MAKYNGFTFKPHREFTEKEKNMTLPEMDRYFGFTWDFELGMFQNAEVHGKLRKFPYSHEGFYKSMKDDAWKLNTTNNSIVMQYIKNNELYIAIN